MGTPAIGYDVYGLRDSIRHDETGNIVEKKLPEAMAQ
jgi:glycosyltransferase involved in cell wall biosynthesis